MSVPVRPPTGAGVGSVRPPVQPDRQAAATYTGRRAGIVTRLVANTVDFVVVVVVVAGGYAVTSAVIFLWSPAAFQFPEPSGGLLLISGGVVLFLYLTVAWALTGRTYGDHLLGVRVVNYRGERMLLAGAAARAALCVVFPIGVLYVLISPANRSVQDVILRTSVVYDWGHTTAVTAGSNGARASMPGPEWRGPRFGPSSPGGDGTSRHG